MGLHGTQTFIAPQAPPKRASRDITNPPTELQIICGMEFFNPWLIMRVQRISIEKSCEKRLRQNAKKKKEERRAHYTFRKLQRNLQVVCLFLLQVSGYFSVSQILLFQFNFKPRSTDFYCFQQHLIKAFNSFV